MSEGKRSNVVVDVLARKRARLARKMSNTATSEPKGCSSDFDVATQATRAALERLAEHWSTKQEMLTSSASAQLAKDPDAFSADAHAWSVKVGMNFVLPSKALQCEASSGQVAGDSLTVSTAGGPSPAMHPSLIIAPAPPCGFGVYATAHIPKGETLGEYVGEVRQYDIWCDEIKARKRQARGSDASVPFIREELYAAWSGDGPAGAGVVVDAFSVGNAMRFINCSCNANCHFKNFGRGSENHARLQVITDRDVEPWEQLSVDYGWWFDDATRSDVREQALTRYCLDRPALRGLSEWSRQVSGEAGQVPERSAASALAAAEAAAHPKETSVAVQVVAITLAEALQSIQDAKEGLQPSAHDFFRRFTDPKKVADLLLTSGELPEATDYQKIPDAIWPLYEVVGAEIVGIPCRCGLNSTLNSSGKCSGVIGRPLQEVCDGRTDETCDW